MSDYNSSPGYLTPMSYAQVTCTTNPTEGNSCLFKCTCDIYQTIQCAGLSDISLSPEEEVILDELMTGMHCRFFKEFLQSYRNNLQNICTSSSIDMKVTSSLKNMNNPIVLLGGMNPHSTTKLSVCSEDTFAIEHISFNMGNSCFANCQNGQCTAILLNNKKIPKAISIDQNSHLCGHIKTLFANFEVMEQLFPQYFQTKHSEEKNL